jgi:hypothetical protein
MRQWFEPLSRAIFEHRFELAQINTDHAVQELQRRFPNIPVSIAQWLLESSRVAVLTALRSPEEPLPLDFAEQARAMDANARLASALEGFTDPSAVNDDTLILAVRLLEYLQGWVPATALLLRRGDRFGTPLAELGETDVETTSVYLDDEEGWSAASATQVLLAQDMTEYGFYRALLHAFSPHQRTLLGLGLNEPERLHQRLRELALARPERARLLLGLPVHRTWLSPPAVDAVRRHPRADDLDLFRREPVQRRVANLLTQPSIATSLAAEQYIQHLLRSNEPIDDHITQLERERLLLDSSLHSWIEQSPSTAIRQARAHATQQLTHAWEGRITQRHVALELGSAALGELPALQFSLPAVNALSIHNVGQGQNLPTWLQAMPHLQSLALRNMPVDELPAGLTGLRWLRSLDLSWSRLTPTALRPLGALNNLQTLMLNDVHASTFEWSAEDMAQMVASGSLTTLVMQNSRASFGPGVLAALAAIPELYALRLNGNLITLSAQDITDLGGLRQLRRLDLSHNPLGRIPDVSLLHGLEELDLSGLRDTDGEWPHGLEHLAHISEADLSGLVITSVPEGAGRTRGLVMYSDYLPEQMRQRFEEELSSVGNRIFGSDDSMGSGSPGSPGSSGSSGPAERYENALRDATRLFVGMASAEQAQASQLLEIPDAAMAEFFALLLRIDVSRDAQRPEANMRGRLQALIRGAFNADLRRALNEQARQAVTCVDRDAVVFSQMENLLHADLALAKANDASAANGLIALATSHWRVHRLKEHVTRHISEWRAAGHTIDYSEIELYFRIALAERLALRDQPRTQMFSSYTRWVSPEMLDAACSAVLAEQAALLPGYLSKQPYWERFLDSAYAAQTEVINHWRNRVGEYLDSASSNEQLPPELSASEQQHLHQVLVASGRLAALEPLPAVLTLNSSEYRAAYEALLQLVGQARLALTKAIMEPQPGPSSRP